MGFLSRLLGSGSGRSIRAREVYERTMAKYGLPPVEEYFAVLGVSLFLVKDPAEALNTLYAEILKYDNATGILAGGLGPKNFEIPMRELLAEYQKEIEDGTLTRDDVMRYMVERAKPLKSALFVEGALSILEKKAKKKS